MPKRLKATITHTPDDSVSVLTMHYDHIGVVEYKYEAGFVQIPARADAMTVPVANFKNTVRQVRDWIRMVEQFGPPRRPLLPHWSDESFDGSVFRIDYWVKTDHGPKQRLLDLAHTAGSDSIEMKARDSIALPWYDFIQWMEVMEHVLVRIRRTQGLF